MIEVCEAFLMIEIFEKKFQILNKKNPRIKLIILGFFGEETD